MIKERIRKILREKYPETDLSLWAFGIPYGFWVWDGQEHIELKTRDIPEDNVRDGLPVVRLSKEEVFGRRP